MSIQPPSDIVLDVAQAADPVKSMAAAQKLMRMSAPAETASAGFSDVLGNMAAPADDHLANLRGRLSLPEGTADAAASDARTKAYKGMEALVLQNLFEETLPKDDSVIFGKGMAGNVWRSMLAEQLSKQMVKVVDLGLFPKPAAAAQGGGEQAGLLPLPPRPTRPSS